MTKQDKTRPCVFGATAFAALLASAASGVLCLLPLHTTDAIHFLSDIGAQLSAVVDSSAQDRQPTVYLSRDTKMTFADKTYFVTGYDQCPTNLMDYSGPDRDCLRLTPGGYTRVLLRDEAGFASSGLVEITQADKRLGLSLVEVINGGKKQVFPSPIAGYAISQ